MVTLDAKQQPVEDVVAEIAKQSGILTKVDDFPWHGKKASPKLPITIKLDKKPYWEAVVSVSQLADMGIYTNDPGGNKLSTSMQGTSQYQQFGPLTIALVPTAGLEKEQELEFGLRVFYLEDEVELEGDETFMWMKNGKRGGWPVKIKSEGLEMSIMAHSGSLDNFQFSLPKEFRGKRATFSGGLSYSVKKGSGKMSLDLKQDAVAEIDGITIQITEVATKGDKTEIKFETSWANGLPQEMVNRYEKLAKSPNAPKAEVHKFMDELKQKARRVKVHLAGIEDHNGRIVADAVSSSLIRDEFIRGGGNVTIKGPPDGRKLVFEMSRIEAGTMTRAEFKFEDVILGNN